MQFIKTLCLLRPLRSEVTIVSNPPPLPMTADEQRLFGIAKLHVPCSDLPAVTHADYSARIQTVHRETNLLYHALIEHFHALTGCPVVVNTSFNVRGESIVLFAAGRVPVLHENGDRLSGIGVVHARQNPPAAVPRRRRLAEPVPARLTCRIAAPSYGLSGTQDAAYDSCGRPFLAMHLLLSALYAVLIVTVAPATHAQRRTARAATARGEAGSSASSPAPPPHDKEDPREGAVEPPQVMEKKSVVDRRPEEWAPRFGAASQVEFPGFRSDILPLLDQASCLVLPSYSGEISRVAVEMFSGGCSLAACPWSASCRWTPLAGAIESILSDPNRSLAGEKPETNAA